jgi:hypothetical protein
MASPRLIVVAWFALVHCLFAAKAWASCGDWLAHPMRLEPEAASRDHHADLAEIPLSDASRPAAPCNGPLCQRSRQPAAPVAPIQPSVAQRDPGCLSASEAAEEQLPRLQFCQESDLQPSRGFPLGIDRPPRVLAPF